MGIPSYFGLQKTSLVDYPGKIAPVIFFPGCNLRCPYCHNPDLALGRSEGLLTRNKILEFLEFRAPLLGGVVLSGGEPLLYPGLQAFIDTIRKLTHLPVKIDTNGLKPDRIREIRADYIAMDIKVLPEKYSLLGGDSDTPDKIRESVIWLQKNVSSRNYEFRTTLLPSLLPMEDIPALAEIIDTSPHFISGFKPGNCLSEECNSLPPVSADTLSLYQKEFQFHNCATEIRR